MLTGVILAGGESRRMGYKNKALFTFHGEALIQRQVRTMKQLCSEVIVVTNNPMDYLPLLDSSVRIITDYVAGKGPMSGMHAAFTLAKKKLLWLVACDMPFINTSAAKLLLQNKMYNDACLPYVDGRLHPLFGIYDKGCLPKITESIELGRYRLVDFLNYIRVQQLDENHFLSHQISLDFLFNMNTPDSYEEALQKLNI